MAKTSRDLLVAAAMGLLLTAGCASKDEGATNAEPASSGFVWAGQGEPSNFGYDQNFCTRNVGVVRLPMGSQGTVAGVDAMSTGGNTALGSDYASKRRFWQCMQSRGWELTGR